MIRAISLRPLYAPDEDGDGGTSVAPAAPVAPADPPVDDLDLEDEAPPQDALAEEAEDDGGDSPPAAFEPPRRRAASDLIRELKEERKVAAEERRRLEAELAQYRAERERERAALEARTEEDRLVLMSPEERMEHKLSKALEEQRRLMAQQQFTTADMADKAEFRAKLPAAYAKYADEVEKTLQTIRTVNKINVPRDTVLKLVLGEKLLEKAAANSGKPRPPVRQAAPAVNGRGDTTPDRRRGLSLEKRLENVPI